MTGDCSISVHIGRGHTAPLFSTFYSSEIGCYPSICIGELSSIRQLAIRAICLPRLAQLHDKPVKPEPPTLAAAQILGTDETVIDVMIPSRLQVAMPRSGLSKSSNSATFQKLVRLLIIHAC